MKPVLLKKKNLTPEKRKKIISLAQGWLLNGILLAAFIYSARIIILSRQPITQIIEDNGMVSIDLGSK